MNPTMKCGNETADELVTDTSQIVFSRKTSVIDQLPSAGSGVDAPAVKLDFRELESVNSAELSALFRFALELRTSDKIVSLDNVGPHLAEIFAIARFGDWTVS